MNDSLHDQPAAMIEIRPLCAADKFDDLIALSREFFQEYEAHHKDFFKIDVLKDEDIVAYFTHWLDHENGQAIVALEGDRGMGYITVDVTEQVDYWAIKKIGHISGLMVHAQDRHKGIGTRLMVAARKFFEEKAVKYYTVYTAVENRAALEFYRRNGMTPLYTTILGEVSLPEIFNINREE